MPRASCYFAIPFVAAGLAALAMPAPAHAQGKLDARYNVTLTGVTIGKGAWVIEIADDQYTAAMSGTTTGLLRVFASGEGTGAVRGLVANGFFSPLTYIANITADKRSEEVRLSLAGGNIKDMVVDPPTPPHPERIPITDANRRGVMDPITASLVRMPGTGDVVTAEACNRTAPIFDGRMRYDLTMAYKRMEPIKADKGYQGPAVVCALYFRPIAGYIPDRAAIKYLVEQRDMEVYLAPIAGTRVLVPYRVTTPTPLGPGTLQATQFITEAQPRLTPTSIKGQ